VAQGGRFVKRTKLVYILPVYDADSSEHFFHIYSFLEAVAEQLDVLLIVERAHGRPDFSHLKVYQRRIQLPLLRAFEVLAVMLWARLHGYKRFYTHYSMSAGIMSALVTRVFGGVSYYWNCGHPLDFVPEHVRSLSDLRAKLRNKVLLGLTLHMVHHLVTGTITMSHYYSASYDLPLSSICLMPNWVDLRRFAALPSKHILRQQLGWPLDRKIVLFLHRLAERKGAHYIVSIVRGMLGSYPALSSQLFFVIVGAGPYEARLRAQIQDAGLEGQCLLTGWIPNREVAKYFAAADVYMMPSLEEGFPRTLLEAMAAGCPFVAMDVGGVRDIISLKQVPFVVSRGNWQAMAVALGRLLTDDALRDDLACDGRAHVENYSQDRAVQIFTSLVAG